MSPKFLREWKNKQNPRPSIQAGGLHYTPLFVSRVLCGKTAKALAGTSDSLTVTQGRGTFSVEQEGL